MGSPCIISRQEGVYTFTSDTLRNETISNVNTANTWVRLSIRAAESDSISNVSYYCTIDLTSSTNIRLQRGGSSRDTTVEWTVIEFDSSVNVYRGSFVHNLSTEDTTVPSIDLSKSISDLTYRNTSTLSTSVNIRDCVVRNRLTSSTNLRTNVRTGFANATVVWQVIEFTQNISVQQFDNVTTASPINVTISSVTMAKSFIMFS